MDVVKYLKLIISLYLLSVLAGCGGGQAHKKPTQSIPVMIESQFIASNHYFSSAKLYYTAGFAPFSSEESLTRELAEEAAADGYDAFILRHSQTDKKHGAFDNPNVRGWGVKLIPANAKTLMPYLRDFANGKTSMTLFHYSHLLIFLIQNEVLEALPLLKKVADNKGNTWPLRNRFSVAHMELKKLKDDK